MIRRSGRRFTEKDHAPHIVSAQPDAKPVTTFAGRARGPLIDLKFLNELAAGDAGTSNRRH
jgi:hypothetical protein